MVQKVLESGEKKKKSWPGAICLLNVFDEFSTFFYTEIHLFSSMLGM